MAHSSNERAAEIASGGAKSETSAEGGLAAGLKLLLACTAGLLIANLYYAQPLSGLISEALGMAPSSAGLLFSLPVAGYGDRFRFGRQVAGNSDRSGGPPVGVRHRHDERFDDFG